MTTDWILIRRAARRAGAGAPRRPRRRRRAVGRRPGRAPLRRRPAWLGDLGDRPVRLAAAGDARNAPSSAVGVEPGWLRTVGTALRGQRLSGVRARRGDRVLVLAFGCDVAVRRGERGAAGSRAGSPLRKRRAACATGVVVAAAKQFSPADNPTRAVQIGMPYEPPPLPAATLDFPAFSRALEAAADAAARARALGGYLPELPRLLAAVGGDRGGRRPNRRGSPAGLARVARRAGARAAHRGRVGGRTAPSRYTSIGTRPERSPLRTSSRSRRTRRASTSACRRCSTCSRETRSATLRANRGDAVERRRGALLGRIAKRARATADELARTRAKLADAAERDRLRESGDALYTHVHEIPIGATSFVPPTNPALTIALDPELDAKENAQRYYARYRKAADALPHLETPARAPRGAPRRAGRPRVRSRARRRSDARRARGRPRQRSKAAPRRARPGAEREATRAAPSRPALRRADLRRPLAARERRGDVPASRARTISGSTRAGSRARTSCCNRRRDAIAGRKRLRRRSRSRRDAQQSEATRRASRSTTPSASTSASSATPRRASVWYTNARTRVGRQAVRRRRRTPRTMPVVARLATSTLDSRRCYADTPSVRAPFGRCGRALPVDSSRDRRERLLGRAG